MARLSKPKYRGILNKPIVHRPPPTTGNGLLSVSTAEAEKIEQEIADQWVADISARLSALYEHYGIDSSHPMAQLELIITLARDHIVGFTTVSSPTRGPGAPAKWKGSDKSAMLYADVKALERKGHSALGACRILAESPRYAARYGGQKQQTLYRRYQAALNNLPPMLEAITKQSRADGAPVDDWLIETYAIEAEERWAQALADRRILESGN